jgi:GNAT superfamily N-acetyltransferase
MLQFREYQSGDTLYLIDIETKATEFPADADDWSRFGECNGELMLATWNNEPVGFIAWSPDPLGYFIVRMAVKPSYQNRGIGRACVEKLAEYARTQGIKNVLACPDEAEWFKHIGFKESSFNLYHLAV